MLASAVVVRPTPRTTAPLIQEFIDLMGTTKNTSATLTAPPPGPKRAGRLQLQNINNGQRSLRQQQRRLILGKLNTKHPKKPRAKASTTKTNQKAVSGGHKVTFQSEIDVIPQRWRRLSIRGDAIPSDDGYSKLDVIMETSATQKFNGMKQPRSVKSARSRLRRPLSSNKSWKKKRITKERAQAVDDDTASSTPWWTVMSPAADLLESLGDFVDTFIDSIPCGDESSVCGSGNDSATDYSYDDGDKSYWF